jgi:hypothetical protein
MTDHAVRLYALIAAVLVFFVAWAAVAARPWATTSTTSATADPRVAALVARQQRVRAKALAVQRVLAKRQSAATTAPVPAVKIVALPPLTITRTS